MAQATVHALRREWDWQSLGWCGNETVGQFFHPDGENSRYGRLRREALARRICQGCPVRAECAGHALAAGEEYGVWGGLTEGDRARLQTMGWRDAWDPVTGRVDVRRLEHRLNRASTQRDQSPVRAR